MFLGDVQTITYTVVSGDTLSKIAARYGTTVAKIVDDNGIDDPDSINVGDQLDIDTASPNLATKKTSAINVFSGNTIFGIDKWYVYGGIALVAAALLAVSSSSKTTKRSDGR